MLRAVLFASVLAVSARAQTGRILSHDLRVTLRPAAGLDAEDRMRVRVAGPGGLELRLNPGARIESPREAKFSDGILHLDLPAGETAVTVRYSLPIPHDPDDPNSACFREHAGHVRNQYFWHPTLDFASAGAWADFHIEVRIPRQYRLTTSLPQTERVEGETRVVDARTVQPAGWLTLAYDRDWQIETREIGGFRLEFFVTAGFDPAPDAVAGYFLDVYAVLSKRFGPLPARYTAIVQLRNLAENSWRFSSNQAVFSAARPALLFKPSPAEEPFAHEVAHMWNNVFTGAAGTFLGEGWAVWAESLVVQNRSRSESARDFWSFRSSLYLLAFDGRESLVDDSQNGGIAYLKGPWVYRMLESALGQPAFDQAMREFFTRSRATPAGWEFLAECAQRHAPPDFDARAFLEPWLKEKTAPRLTSEIAGATVTVRQDPPVFLLPLTIEAGTERRRIWLRGAEARVTFSAPVSAVKLDPDESLLLRR
jgi:hypothetical protein